MGSRFTGTSAFHIARIFAEISERLLLSASTCIPKAIRKTGSGSDVRIPPPQSRKPDMDCSRVSEWVWAIQ